MLNRIILIGRMVADPEIRFTQSGIPMANFSIAVERNFKSATGEKLTDFIRIVAWRKQAELIGEYVKKGYMVAVEGSLQQRKYQTKEGENRTIYEVMADSVQFLDRGGRGGGEHTPPPSDTDAPPSYEDYGGSSVAEPAGEHEDELPF